MPYTSLSSLHTHPPHSCALVVIFAPQVKSKSVKVLSPTSGPYGSPQPAAVFSFLSVLFLPNLHPIHQLDQQSVNVPKRTSFSQLLPPPKPPSHSCFSFLWDRLTCSCPLHLLLVQVMRKPVYVHLGVQGLSYRSFHGSPQSDFSFSLPLSLPHMNSWSISYPSSFHPHHPPPPLAIFNSIVV